MTTIANAGNVVVPAYLALKQRGYTIACSDDGLCWKATSGECELIGEDPVALLALAALYETRGPAWQASDDEIESFLRQYANGTPRL